VAYSARLESDASGDRHEGSNPSPSAKKFDKQPEGLVSKFFGLERDENAGLRSVSDEGGGVECFCML
jgi:hypothetical protein